MVRLNPEATYFLPMWAKARSVGAKKLGQRPPEAPQGRPGGSVWIGGAPRRPRCGPGGASSQNPTKSGLCSVPQGCIIGHNRPATPVNLEYICLLLRNMQNHLGLAGSAAEAESLLRVQRCLARPATSAEVRRI